MIIIKNTYALGLFVPTIVKTNNGMISKIPGYCFKAEVDIKDGTEIIIKQGATFSKVKIQADNQSVVIISSNKILNILFILAWIAFIILCFFGPSSTAFPALKLSGLSFYVVLSFPVLFLLCLVYFSYIRPGNAIKVTRIK